MFALKKTIEEAFANVSYPGDNNITHCPYRCSECQRVTDFFKGRKWTELTLEELQQYHAALALFTPEALHYFLPAYMTATLRPYERGDVIPDAIRFHFEHSQEAREFYAVAMSQFTLAQRHVIIDYLVGMERRGAGSVELAIELLSDDSAYEPRQSAVE